MPRQPIEQTFSLGSLGVTNAAQPISPLDITSMISSFIICNFSSNTNSVFWGDNTVTTTTGIEITPGSAPVIFISEERQFYEIQNALIRIYEMAKCEAFPQPDLIPIICWNPSHIYLITSVAGPVPVSLLFFKNVYT